VGVWNEQGEGEEGRGLDELDIDLDDLDSHDLEGLTEVGRMIGRMIWKVDRSHDLEGR